MWTALKSVIVFVCAYLLSARKHDAIALRGRKCVKDVGSHISAAKVLN